MGWASTFSREIIAILRHPRRNASERSIDPNPLRQPVARAKNMGENEPVEEDSTGTSLPSNVLNLRCSNCEEAYRQNPFPARADRP